MKNDVIYDSKQNSIKVLNHNYRILIFNQEQELHAKDITFYFK